MKKELNDAFLAGLASIREHALFPLDRDEPPTLQELADWLEHPEPLMAAMVEVSRRVFDSLDEPDAPMDPRLAAAVQEMVRVAPGATANLNARTALFFGFAFGYALAWMEASPHTRGARKVRHHKREIQQARRADLAAFIGQNGPVPPKGPPRRQNPLRTKYRQKFFRECHYNVDRKTFDTDVEWIRANPT